MKKIFINFIIGILVQYNCEFLNLLFLKKLVHTKNESLGRVKERVYIIGIVFIRDSICSLKCDLSVRKDFNFIFYSSINFSKIVF
jgi:hypothetical protein